MSDPFVPHVGAVFSADIAVPEHDREVRFYSRVLSTGDNPLWRAEDLMNNLGLPIIGLGALSAEYAQLPLQWMRLTMRCSEPGHRAVVAIHASLGPGR